MPDFFSISGMFIWLFDSLSAQEEGYRVLQSSSYSSEYCHICIYAMIAHLLLRYTYDVVGMWSATSAVSLLVGFFLFFFCFFLCIF